MENQNDFYPQNSGTPEEKTFEVPIAENLYTEENKPSAPIGADGLQGVVPQEAVYQNIQPQYVVYQPIIPNGHTAETYKEKKRIKKAARIIGISFLVMFSAILVLNIVIAFASIIFAVVTNSDSPTALLEDAFVMHVLQIVLSMFAFTVPFIIVYKCFRIKIGKYISFSKPKSFWALSLFGIGFCAFANVASSIAQSIFESFGNEIPSVAMENPEGIFGFLIAFISTAVLPAFVEEFACRGLVMGVLRKIGDRFAIVASAILFGLMHGNFEQIPFAFLVGLVLGFIAIKSGSLWPAVFVHFFNNLAAVVFSYLPVSVNLSNILYLIFLCVCMCLGVVGLFLAPKEKSFFSIEKGNSPVTEKKKYLYFFTGIPICFTVGYCLLEAVLAFFV